MKHTFKFSLSKSKATKPIVVDIDDRVQAFLTEKELFKIKNDIDNIIVKLHRGK